MLIRSLNGEDLMQEEMETPPVLLMGKFNGQKPVGYSPWGLIESDSVESLSKELEMCTIKNYSYFLVDILKCFYNYCSFSLCEPMDCEHTRLPCPSLPSKFEKWLILVFCFHLCSLYYFSNYKPWINHTCEISFLGLSVSWYNKYIFQDNWISGKYTEKSIEVNI